jgi:CcmD family protein
MLNTCYLVAGYLILLLIIFVYILALGLKFKALNRKLSQLEKMQGK